MAARATRSGAGERCTWCGGPVERDDGFRLTEAPGERQATFCRLEHVVPWAIQGAHWEAGDGDETPENARNLDSCAHCGAELDDVLQPAESSPPLPRRLVGAEAVTVLDALAEPRAPFSGHRRG